jgi:hypothetical protein
MEINVATPALLFPAITLLLLAYTNRFLGLATLIRGLAVRYAETHASHGKRQHDPAAEVALDPSEATDRVVG